MEAYEIRAEARTQLEGHWTELIPVWIIYLLIFAGIGFVFGSDGGFLNMAANLVLGGPFLMGITGIFLKLYRREPFELGNLFDGFKDFSRTLSAYLLISLYVFLWLLLLIVPGIIAALGYSMTFFIMADNPNLPASEALRQSKAMMQGHKTELFLLGLSFIGWILLAILTMGIGLLWLNSYVYASYTIFYHRIKGQGESFIN